MIRNRVSDAAELVTLMPVTRWFGAYSQPDMVVAMPIFLWDAILKAVDAE